MNTKSSKSALLKYIDELQAKQIHHQTSVKNSRKAGIPNVLQDLDVSEYKITSFGTRHLEAIKYIDFAHKLRQANPEKIISAEVVEACSWKAVDEQLRSVGGKGPVGERIVAEGRTVMAQANKYWEEIVLEDENEAISKVKLNSHNSSRISR